MDKKNMLSIITTTGNVTPETDESPGSSTRRKRRGPAQLFKVAMFMIRRRSFKSKPADVAAASTTTDNMLNRLVGSVRPLMHLQSNEDGDGYDSSSAEAAAAARVVVAEEPFSPATTWSENDDGMSSRYGSAANLQELEHRYDQSESRYASAVNLRDMDENSEVNGVDYGDEMIDAKAEEFIAQFYAQIRLQRYNEMVERSIA